MSLDFTISELIKSNTATTKHINNIPTDVNILNNMLYLITDCLQPIRDLIGKPIIITSGYRCNKLNQAVGGAKNSHHKLGTCADIQIRGMQAKDLYKFIKNNGFQYRQLIMEKNQWVHIEFKKDDLKKENLLYNGTKYILDNK